MSKYRTGPRLLVLAMGLLVFASVWGQAPYGPVKKGESVYSILKSRVLADDLNLRQWALATMAMNPSAFGDSVGELRSGSMLTIPSPDQARRQWRRGLALEAGEVRAPKSVATVQPLGVSESQVAVPAPVWTKDPATAAVRAFDAEMAELSGEAAPTSTAPPTAATSKEVNAGVEGAAQALDLSPELENLSGQLDELSAVSSNTTNFSDDPLYQTAMASIGSKPSAELLSRMMDLEASYAGDADYDYALGVLLLDSGRPQDAIFALLRASQTRPKSLGIRLDLGRAYFEANDNESARTIFSSLEKQSPPPAAAEVIDSYQQAITRRSSRYNPTWVSQIGLESGFDSNANGATDLRNFLGFSLDEQSRSAESGFAELGLNSQFAKPLTPRWRWLLGAQARYREHFDAAEFNTLQYDLSTGLSYRRGGWELSGRLGATGLQVDGEDNATTLGLTGGWNWSLSPFVRLQSSMRVGTVRYEDQLSVRDVNQWLLAVGLNRRGQIALGSEISLTLLGGQDEAVDDNSPYGRNLGGLQTGVLVQLSPRVRANFNLQGLLADYDGNFFGSQRRDVQWSTVLGLELVDNRLPGWTLAPRLSYVDNSSDVDLFEYDRFVASLRVSRSFD